MDAPDKTICKVEQNHAEGGAGAGNSPGTEEGKSAEIIEMLQKNRQHRIKPSAAISQHFNGKGAFVTTVCYRACKAIVFIK